MLVIFTFRRNFNWPKAGEWKLTHTHKPRIMSEADVKIEVCRLQSQLPPYVLVEAVLTESQNCAMIDSDMTLCCTHA